ncbi:CCHC-type domain-containing protein [Plasmodiophora brassicae]
MAMNAAAVYDLHCLSDGDDNVGDSSVGSCDAGGADVLPAPVGLIRAATAPVGSGAESPATTATPESSTLPSPDSPVVEDGSRSPRVVAAESTPSVTPGRLGNRLSRGSAGRYFCPIDITVKCHNCNEVGHMRAQCTAGRPTLPCFLCGLTTHKANRCPTTSDKAVAMFTTCWICGQAKHPYFRCSRADSVDANHARLHCYVCGAHGHMNCGKTAVAVQRRPSCSNCASTDHATQSCRRPDVTQSIHRSDLLGYDIRSVKQEDRRYSDRATVAKRHRTEPKMRKQTEPKRGKQTEPKQKAHVGGKFKRKRQQQQQQGSSSKTTSKKRRRE